MTLSELAIGLVGRALFGLPLSYVTETGALLGKRGSGKTYLLRKLAEAMIGAGLPVVIIDPIGVCWGLRSSANGKRDGLPVIIFGGDHGDLPLEAESGSVLADWVIAERRPTVFDLSGLTSKAAERRFVADFAERIYRKNRDALHIILDEADVFAPQSPQQGDKRMLGAINTLARRGRARGIGLTMATQRSAVLNKNVLTQAEILVAMRLTAPQDRKAIEAWIEYHGTKEDRHTVLGSLGDLPQGTAWFWSPALLGGIHRVKVGLCKTFDSSATPKAGAKIVRPKLGPVDLGELSEKIEATVERAKAEDPAALRAAIARARADLDRSNKEILALQAELKNRPGGLSASQIDRLRDAHILAGDAAKLADTACGKVARLRRELGVWPDKSSRSPTKDADKTTSADVDLRIPSLPIAEGRKLKGGERRILTALAQHGAINKRRLAALTGYKMTGGGFQNLLSALRVAEEITRGEPIEITDAGRSSLGEFTPLPTGRRLLEMWLVKLQKAPRLCLEQLYDAYPDALSRDELAECTGYAAKGGGFQNAISRLNTLGLIDRTKDGIRATENLFE